MVKWEGDIIMMERGLIINMAIHEISETINLQPLSQLKRYILYHKSCQVKLFQY